MNKPVRAVLVAPFSVAAGDHGLDVGGKLLCLCNRVSLLRTKRRGDKAQCDE